jgi:DNA polymerase-3 subunit alpha
MEKLQDYLENQKIDFTENEGVVTINNQTYELIYPNIDNMLFDNHFHLLVKETECHNYVFEFGEKYYHLPKGKEKEVELNELKYLGQAKQGLDTDSFLGIRGQYELLNGSRLYKDWVRKAKFLGIKTLGICEKNTLAGTLKFQLECKKNNIKSILGATYTVYREAEEYRYDIKCYAKNAKGWENLLLINKEVLVTNSKFIKEEDLFKLTGGLFIVFDPKSIDFEKVFPWDLTKDNHFYQLDTVEFKDNGHDKWYLENLKKFVNSKMEPLPITDAFYLDKEDSHIKQKLNTIGGFQEYTSNNQHFKNKEDYFSELQDLFGDFSRAAEICGKAINNEGWIAANCNFKIETEKKFLPKYKMTEQEKKDFKTNEDLFWYLIEQGVQKKTPDGKIDEYLERIGKEVEVINLVKGYDGATGIDYFLILWDIVRYCKENRILVGHGRGSSAGAVVAYYLDITQIDPIEWGLYFERFLNPSRALGKEIKDTLITVETDEGINKYWSEDRVDIERDNRKINISASQLHENDIIL